MRDKNFNQGSLVFHVQYKFDQDRHLIIEITNRTNYVKKLLKLKKKNT